VDAREFLGITRISETSWRLEVAERLITPGRFLYGGCGLGAGLAALEEATGRPTVWGTAQYLSFAPLGSTVQIDVDLAVVGAHITQARARASVEGREVLTVNAALGEGELDAPQPFETMPEVAAPELCPVRRLPHHYDRSIFEHVETRLAIGRRFSEFDGTPGPPRSALWARLPGHVETTSATLAIFADLLSGGATEPMGRRVRGRSLDNTLRVARVERSEWILCEMRMHALRGGFGQGTALLWSREGQLLASASQSFAARLAEP
jgi:acyl-CoA thioesterase-2